MILSGAFKKKGREKCSIKMGSKCDSILPVLVLLGAWDDRVERTGFFWESGEAQLAAVGS